jgi:protein-tyrosine phosphatase
MENFSSDLRTSISHPIAINTLPAAAGSLGLTFCPGKKQQQSMTGGWNRDLGIDLQAFHAWGADIVISLMEHFEYDEIHVPNLPAEFERQFQLWLDLPIIDKCAPDEKWLERRRVVRWVIANALINGQRILIHCKGGLGRTGTIAAMILHDLGTPIPEAIQRVRATRRGTIETVEQEQCLVRYHRTTITPARYGV